MTRRLVRTGIQLVALACVIIFVVVFLDRRYTLLPQSIHNHLPAHHPGLVITDVTVRSCSSLNPISSCRLDPDRWHRIEKDLYLNKGWLNKAYVHVRRKMEEELTVNDKVVIDVRVGRLDPTVGEKEEADTRWESRPGGIWLKRSMKKHESDSSRAVTAIDVLFGVDAVEPRPSWEIKDTPLILDNAQNGLEPKLSVRRGKPPKNDPAVLRIRKDGKFKIMQVSDLHLSTGVGDCRDPVPPDYNSHGSKCEADPRTLDFVGKMFDDEKPDFVVLSGDQVNGDTSADAQTTIFKFAELLIKRKIPYATIYGNHDDEGSLNRAAMMELTETLPYSLSAAGPPEIDGVGNYYVEVLAPTGQHSAMTIYFLDTHSYSPDERNFHGYDWLKPNQIKWFNDTAEELRKSENHIHYTHIRMDMAFIHIPLPEIAQNGNEIVGEWREGVTAPQFNSHFKDALVGQGVSVVSCGHDHANDYCSLSRTEDSTPELWLCYAGGSGFGGYGGYRGYVRRIRVFDIDTGENRIKTWKRIEYPEEEDRVDEQIIVSGGKVVHS